MTATLVADASVLVKAVVREAGTDDVNRLIAAGVVFVAPELAFVEVANALRRKVVLKEIDQAQAIVGQQAVVQVFTPLAVVALTTAEEALKLGLQLGHSVHDCHYLAMAIALGEKLVTADDKFARKLTSTAHASSIMSLLEAARSLAP